MNKVLLTGRLTRDPEMRALASGKSVTQFSVATNEYAGHGKERAEYHNIVTWDKLAEICARYLGKGQQVSIEGRIQTRTYDDKEGNKKYITEIIAADVQFLGGGKGEGGPGGGKGQRDDGPPPPGDGDFGGYGGGGGGGGGGPDDDIPF